jgi:hypothetical protein
VDLNYTHLQHRHRFAAWAAARAVQRGFAGSKGPALVNALEAIDAPAFISSELGAVLSSDMFDEFHRNACRKIIAKMRMNSIDASYGRAAKLLAVYLKAMLTIASESNSELSRFMHPPIDRLLLQKISKEKGLPAELRSVPKIELDLFRRIELFWFDSNVTK